MKDEITEDDPIIIASTENAPTDSLDFLGDIGNIEIPEVNLDIFGGSGTTLIAAEQLGRQCRMVEFDPVYADVIVKRWEELTGEQARYLGNCLDEAEKANSTKHTP